MVTSLYAALCGLFFVGLSLYVVKGRVRFSVALGDNSEEEMRRRIRAQGNFSEYAPLFLVMLGLAEYSRLPSYAVHFLGMLFLAGRMMHAYSLLKHERYHNGKLAAVPLWRIRGMQCTFSALGLTALVFWYNISAPYNIKFRLPLR